MLVRIHAVRRAEDKLISFIHRPKMKIFSDCFRLLESRL